MKFLVDESSDARIRDYLNSRCHDATSIAVDHQCALPDEEVLAIAVKEQRILITNDRDVGELIFRLQRPHCGVVFFRTPPVSWDQKRIWLDRVIRDYRNQLGQFIVVAEHSIRVRTSTRSIP
jgi:predicted nuclease of predicted toxin-antitoxin system